MEIIVNPKVPPPRLLPCYHGLYFCAHIFKTF